MPAFFMPKEKNMNIKTVDAKTLNGWIGRNEAVLVDVREPQEHKAKNIPAAKLIPLGSLSEQTLPEINGRKLVLHCGGGGRAGRACEKLMSENPDIEVYNLSGGLSAWKSAGYEVNETLIEDVEKNYCETKK